MCVAHGHTIENGLHCQGEKEKKDPMRISSYISNAIHQVAPQLLWQHDDRQGNNMHGRRMFGKHAQVHVYDILRSPVYVQI